MKHHHCLLLSLFDYPLILNNNKDSNNKYYTISFKENKNNGLSNLFYDSKPDNYGFVIVDEKVRKIKFNELNMNSLKTNTNDYEYEHLSFSELTDRQDVLGGY